jgi:hypothetical protein
MTASASDVSVLQKPRHILDIKIAITTGALTFGLSLLTVAMQVSADRSASLSACVLQASGKGRCIQGGKRLLIPYKS